MKNNYTKPLIHPIETFIDYNLAIGSGYYEEDNSKPIVTDFINDETNIEGIGDL